MIEARYRFTIATLILAACWTGRPSLAQEQEVIVEEIATDSAEAADEEDDLVGTIATIEMGPDGEAVIMLADGTEQPLVINPDNGSGNLQIFSAPVTAGVNARLLPNATVQGAAPASGRGGANLAESRKAAVQAVRDRLGASEEEWKVLQPKLLAIQALRTAIGDTRGSGTATLAALTAHANTRSGPKLPGRVSEVIADYRSKQLAFRKAMNDKNTSDEKLAPLMSALRTSEQRVREQLAASRKDLTQFVTRRQEAILYQWGLLD